MFKISLPLILSYEYKVEKLQELEQKAEEGKIELYNLEKKSVSLCVNCYFKHKKS